MTTTTLQKILMAVIIFAAAWFALRYRQSNYEPPESTVTVTPPPAIQGAPSADQPAAIAPAPAPEAPATMAAPSAARAVQLPAPSPSRFPASVVYANDGGIRQSNFHFLIGECHDSA